MATNNNFTVSGFVAVDATVKNNENGSAWANFPLSVTIKKTDKDGKETRVSALQTIEVSTKKDSPKLDLLKKGTLIKVTGFFEPRNWTDKDGKERQSISWKATAIEEVTKAEAKEEEAGEA